MTSYTSLLSLLILNILRQVRIDDQIILPPEVHDDRQTLYTQIIVVLRSLLLQGLLRAVRTRHLGLQLADLGRQIHVAVLPGAFVVRRCNRVRPVQSTLR